MNSIRVHTLATYVLCENCRKVLVKQVYEEFTNKPLCLQCRTPQSAKKAQREFNAAGAGWVKIVPAVIA
jgi:uncharacterized CHY-type Zn-finger protein